MTTKFERQGTILRLVQQQPLSTQAEVAEALRAHGIDAVQATVSRDIAQLGLVKVRNADGRLVYALPGAADLRRLDELDRARCGAGRASSPPPGTCCVIATPRGFAAALADAIDAADARTRSPARSPATTRSSSPRATASSRRRAGRPSCGATCE